jgi:uncharacterized protein
MQRARWLLMTGIGVAWCAACVSPTVTLATQKPIEIKIELQHEVRVHIDREVSELISTEAAGPAVRTRSGEPADEELVRAAKTRGAVGEQANGYLGLRSADSSPADRALGDRVNARRREGYQALAKQNGVPLEQVEKTGGASRIAAAAPGEAIRTPDGRWIEKDEATVVVVKDQPGA